MNKEIRCAYVELKNKFGVKEDVIFKEAVVCKEVIRETIGTKVKKHPVSPTSKQNPMSKRMGSSATVESLMELQKYFNLN